MSFTPDEPFELGDDATEVMPTPGDGRGRVRAAMSAVSVVVFLVVFAGLAGTFVFTAATAPPPTPSPSPRPTLTASPSATVRPSRTPDATLAALLVGPTPAPLGGPEWLLGVSPGPGALLGEDPVAGAYVYLEAFDNYFAAERLFGWRREPPATGWYPVCAAVNAQVIRDLAQWSSEPPAASGFAAVRLTVNGAFVPWLGSVRAVRSAFGGGDTHVYMGCTWVASTGGPQVAALELLPEAVPEGVRGFAWTFGE